MKQIQIYSAKIKGKSSCRDKNNLKFILISEISLKNFSEVTQKQEI
jgi:hypothetical protein